MQGEIWNLNVSEGVMAHIHGWGYTIREVYIPDLEISLNVTDGIVHCFKTKSEDRRYTSDTGAVKIGDIEIPFMVVNAIGDLTRSKDLIKDWFEEGKHGQAD